MTSDPGIDLPLKAARPAAGAAVATTDPTVATTDPEAAPRISAARAILVETRPRQWTKNLVIFAPLLFSLNLSRTKDVVAVVFAFVLFCLISGGVYIVNDLHDRERDRLHHRRRLRPLAAGQLDPTVAVAAATVLLGAGLVGAALVDPALGLVALGYILLQGAYTFVLKKIVLLDVMSIAAGFVLRVAAGAVVIGVAVSPWLLTCAALLSLFLALVKRRHELLADPHALEHRPVLRQYTPEFLDQVISIVTAATLAVYAIYTFLSQSAEASPYLMLTIPFVAYGLLRYLFLMHSRHAGGNPEEVLLGDAALAIDLGLWAAVVVIVLYAT
ncbi:MAG: decaprenyl-phosphate phosphoribosyltransferase [Actinomycetes bacterium]